MKKKLFLFGALVLFSIFLIGIVSACHSTPECYCDSDCPEDYYSETYCSGDDVYKDFHDFSCVLGECAEDIINELVEDCEEDYCEEWQYFCVSDDVYRERTCYEKGCECGSCFSDVNMEEEFVKECDYMCMDGECIDEPVEPECYADEDCGIDHCLGGPNYCLYDDVYQDFITYTCNNPGEPDAYCSSEIIPWLLEVCLYGCENSECLDEPEEPICGNGVLETGEQCDDSNLINGDGCSSECLIEYCGDGIINNIDEECEEDCDCSEGYYCDDCLCYEEPECYIDEDCFADYYSDDYCVGDDVYKDFYDFSCVGNECVENIISELAEECEFSCEDDECVEEEDDDDNRRCCRKDDSHEVYDKETLAFYNKASFGSEEGRIILIGQPDSVGQEDSVEKSGKITDSSWIIYLFIGCIVLLVLILISLVVKR